MCTTVVVAHREVVQVLKSLFFLIRTLSLLFADVGLVPPAARGDFQKKKTAPSSLFASTRAPPRTVFPRICYVRTYVRDAQSYAASDRHLIGSLEERSRNTIGGVL